MRRENKLGILGTALFLAAFLLQLPMFGDSYSLHTTCAIAGLIGIGLILLAGVKGARWWWLVFLSLVFALGWIAVFVEHQH